MAASRTQVFWLEKSSFYGRCISKAVSQSQHPTKYSPLSRVLHNSGEL